MRKLCAGVQPGVGVRVFVGGADVVVGEGVTDAGVNVGRPGVKVFVVVGVTNGGPGDTETAATG